MKNKCEFCKIWLIAVITLLVGFYIAWQFVPPTASDHLRIATGSKEGAYYQYAKAYQEALKQEGITLTIQTTAGSVEALQLLRENKVDVAFIQGGIAENEAAIEKLRSIASLFYEPLWAFTRKGLDNKACDLESLKGKRIAIGEEGSGTRALSTRLLNDNGIQPNNTDLSNLSGEEAVSQLETGKLDAAFFVTAPTSTLITKLTQNPDIHILNFQRHADAYTRHYRFLDALQLGEGSLNLKNNIPSRKITLLTTTAALVVNDSVHADHVRLLTREALRIHHKPGLLEEPWQFPSRYHLEIPIHPDADSYLTNGPSLLEKYLPFTVAARLDQLKIMLIPLLTLLFPLAKSIIPFYKWRIRSRTYRWYKDLNKIDRELDEYDLTQTQQAIETIPKMHSELAQEVSVPLSHMSEFYALRMHTDHILNRLREHETVLKEQHVKQMPAPKDTLVNRVKAEPVTHLSQVKTSDDTNKSIQQEQHQVDKEGQSPKPDTKRIQAERLVKKHAATAMALGTIPIPVLDVATMTGTQLNLLHSLSDLYGHHFERKKVRATVVSMLSSILPTTTIMGLSSLSKSIPGIGTLAGGAGVAALSGAIIYATGKTFIDHFEAGGTLESFDSKEHRETFKQTLREEMKNKNNTLLEQRT